MATDQCYPHKSVPECFEFPVEDFFQRSLLNEIVSAWKIGTYVIAIKGDEFTI